MPHPVTFRTLGDYRRHGHYLVANCPRCQRGAILGPDALIQRFYVDATPAEIERRLRCMKCQYGGCKITIDHDGRPG